MDRARIDNSFTYHPPHGDQTHRYEELRNQARSLAHTINDYVPESAEKTMAIEKLEEAIMWANKAIACNEPAPKSDEIMEDVLKMSAGDRIELPANQTFTGTAPSYSRDEFERDQFATAGPYQRQPCLVAERAPMGTLHNFTGRVCGRELGHDSAQNATPHGDWITAPPKS